MKLQSSRFDIHLVENRLPADERAKRMDSPIFGKVFSEHMVVIPYKDGEWGRGELKAYAPIELDPAANVLHYGQAIFEGFKAYRQPDDSVKCFRPDSNARRFNESAARLSMPELPVDLFVEAAELLAAADEAWVPPTLDAEGIKDLSYYFRPFMIGTGHFLGVKAADEYLFILIGGPAGPYFPQGIKPVTIWVEEEFVRAAPGGTGRAKCAGNYAASLLPGRLAKERGCDQVLYLDAVHRKYLEELGGMNVFLVFNEGGKKVIHTPEKSGTILEGITRESLIATARDMGYEIRERRIEIAEIEACAKDGSLLEAFACGTAAVITPIGTFRTQRGTCTLNNGELGEVSMKLRGALLALQYGKAEDKKGWLHKLV